MHFIMGGLEIASDSKLSTMRLFAFFPQESQVATVTIARAASLRAAFGHMLNLGKGTTLHEPQAAEGLQPRPLVTWGAVSLAPSWPVG